MNHWTEDYEEGCNMTWLWLDPLPIWESHFEVMHTGWLVEM